MTEKENEEKSSIVKYDNFGCKNHQPGEDINLCYNKFKSYQ